MKLTFLFLLLTPALLQEKPAPIPVKPVEQPAAKAAAPEPSIRAPEAGSQRNQNIQINLIDNNALNEQLSRQGMQIGPVREFTALRSNYAAEFGGLGRNLDIVAADRRSAYHGEIFEMLQNNVF